MAEPQGNGSIVDVFLGLPPQLQGIAALGAGVVLGYFVLKKFRANFQNPEQQGSELVLGKSMRSVDMQPIRDLIKQMDLLTLQMMKNDTQIAGFIAAISESRTSVLAATNDAQVQLRQDLSQLADLLSTHLAEIRIDREREDDREREREAEDRGYQAGLKARSPPRRRSPARKKVT